MSEYSNELRHYGVKGMKWGVRRAIGIKARAAGVYKKSIDDIDRIVGKLEKRKATKGLTNREVKFLDRQKKNRQEASMKRDTFIKDLSPEDIKRGERAVMAKMALGGLVGGVSALNDMRRANKLVERERNR